MIVPFDLAKLISEKIKYLYSSSIYLLVDYVDYCSPLSDDVKTANKGDLIRDYENCYLPSELEADDFIYAPDLNYIIDWLYDNKNIFIEVSITNTGFCYYIYSNVELDDNMECNDNIITSFVLEKYNDSFRTPIEAKLKAVEYIFKNLIV